MISNHRLQAALMEIKEIARVDLILYTEKGKLATGTCEPQSDMAEAVVQFAQSMAESQMVGWYHFFKVFVEEQLEYVLLVLCDRQACGMPDPESLKLLPGTV